MISIHIASLIIGLFVGFIGGCAISAFMFFDERYWAGWGQGYDACHKSQEEKQGEKVK